MCENVKLFTPGYTEIYQDMTISITIMIILSRIQTPCFGKNKTRIEER